MLAWKVFEITTKGTVIHGIMLRGRLRRLALEKEGDLLIENASDKENCVRFAVVDLDMVDEIEQYLGKIVPDFRLEKIMDEVSNPVLSKLKVNIEDRYML